MELVFTTAGRRRALWKMLIWFSAGMTLAYFRSGSLALFSFIMVIWWRMALRWGFRSARPRSIIRITNTGFSDLRRPLDLLWSDIRSARIRSFVLHVEPKDEAERPLRYPLIMFNERSSVLIEAIGRHVEVDIGGLVLHEPNPLDGRSGHSWHSWKERGLAQTAIELLFGRSSDPQSLPNRFMRWRLGLDGVWRDSAHSRRIGSSPVAAGESADVMNGAPTSFASPAALDSSRFRPRPLSRVSAETGPPIQPESGWGESGKGVRVLRAVALTALGFVVAGAATREWLAHWAFEARMGFCALISLACLFAYLFASGAGSESDQGHDGSGRSGPIA